MFLHLGSNVSVRVRDVVGIFDYRLLAESTDDAVSFYQQAWARGELESIVKDGSPKSVVITTKKIYLSAISPATLLHRTRQAYQYVEDIKKKIGA